MFMQINNYRKIFNLNKKVALVVGSSRGIGLELAKGLKDYGSKVYCLGRTEKPRASVAAIPNTAFGGNFRPSPKTKS
mgnify:CR=1 FL=1